MSNFAETLRKVNLAMDAVRDGVVECSRSRLIDEGYCAYTVTEYVCPVCGTVRDNYKTQYFIERKWGNLYYCSEPCRDSALLAFGS
jgi:YHS domain-containing protein